MVQENGFLQNQAYKRKVLGKWWSTFGLIDGLFFGQKQSKHIKTNYFKEANMAAFEASKKKVNIAMAPWPYRLISHLSAALAVYVDRPGSCTTKNPCRGMSAVPGCPFLHGTKAWFSAQRHQCTVVPKYPKHARPDCKYLTLKQRGFVMDFPCPLHFPSWKM